MQLIAKFTPGAEISSLGSCRKKTLARFLIFGFSNYNSFIIIDYYFIIILYLQLDQVLSIQYCNNSSTTIVNKVTNAENVPL